MRRRDREVTDSDDLLGIMQRCDVCRLALNDNDGFPYIVPLNFGIQINDKGDIGLIFHSAQVGHKLDLIKADDRASFESVMGKGRIRILSGDEKNSALRALMDQYHPGEDAYYNPAATERTAVYCLDISEMTGKRK